jgi:3-phenylpropionate/trans-cinnamate dioxygenase ferredoxin subunit
MQWQELSSEMTEQIEHLKFQQLLKINFQGKTICVTKLETGIFGIQDTCPHAGGLLHQGHCNKKGTIICPLHGYKFDIQTGKSTDGNNYKISNYFFKEENDKLLIGYK